MDRIKRKSRKIRKIIYKRTWGKVMKEREDKRKRSNQGREISGEYKLKEWNYIKKKKERHYARTN